MTKIAALSTREQNLLKNSAISRLNRTLKVQIDRNNVQGTLSGETQALIGRPFNYAMNIVDDI